MKNLAIIFNPSTGDVFVASWADIDFGRVPLWLLGFVGGDDVEIHLLSSLFIYGSSSVNTNLAPNESIGVELMDGAWTSAAGDETFSAAGDETFSAATTGIDEDADGIRLIAINPTHNAVTEQYDAVVTYINTGDIQFSTLASQNARTVTLSTSPLDDEEDRIAPTTLNNNGDVSIAWRHSLGGDHDNSITTNTLTAPNNYIAVELEDAGWTATIKFPLDGTADGTTVSVTSGEVSF